jgi:cell division cycle protein 37
LTSKSVFSKEVERLKVNPSADKPPTGHEKQPTYDEMILDLLLRVYASAKEEVSKKSFSSTDKEEEEWVSLLKAELKKHEQELGERNVELQKTVEKEEKEMGGKITSEDIREGFSSGVS